MGKILGLDVGIGSLGWAVIDEDQHRIVDFGVRIFESGEEGASKAADRASQVRRRYRSTKRLNKRRKQRKLRLKQFIEEQGIISVEDINKAYRTKGFNPDVWKMRAEGLERKLEPIELAAVLINLSNYRGYQDFYDDADEEDAGKLSEAKNKINTIYNEKRKYYKTIGEMIYREDCFRSSADGVLTIRNKARRENGKKVTDYKYLIDRRYLKDELKVLLSYQREFGYEQLTDDVIDACCGIIFVQRDFEDGPGPNKDTNPKRREAMMNSLKGHQTYSGFDELVGNCPFFPEEKRGHKNSQLYDIYVLINTLSQFAFFDDNGNEMNCPESLVYEMRQQLFEKNGVLTKKDVENLCKKNKVTIRIPTELGKKRNLVKADFIKFLSNPDIFPESFVLQFKEENFDDENALSSKIGFVMAKYATPKRRKDEIHAILSEEEYKLLNYGDKIKTEKTGGGASVSFRYMKEAVEAYFAGVKYGDFQAEFNKKHPQEEKRIYLSPDGKILPITDADMVRNPVVYRSLNETRKIVNAVRAKYKDVGTINVEVAKDVGKSFEQKAETMRFQRENEAKNEKLRMRLIEKLVAENMSVMLADKLIEKFSLWESQKEMCMYSGKKISFAELLSTTVVQVDHIIPQSIVLDETLNNKVLVYTEENQKKQNRLPLEYMPEEQAKDFKNRVNNLYRTENISRAKKEYLLLPVLDTETISGFVDRNINDTRTISKYIANYLRLAYQDKVKVHVIKGAVTSRFRKRWLGSRSKRYGFVPSIYGLEQKTRDLHYYHHAIDAVVVANLTRPYIELAQDYVKFDSMKRDIEYLERKGSGKTAQILRDELILEQGKTVDKMHKKFGLKHEYTKELLSSGYVPSICEDIRSEIEVRVPLEIEFDAKGYVEMEKAFYELRQLLNSVRYNFKDEDYENRSDVVDPDTLEDINHRLPIVRPDVACMKSNAQLVYIDKPTDEKASAEDVSKELNSFVKKLEQRDIKDYISCVRMLSEEEYADRVHEYYTDTTFSEKIEIPYVSFKIDRKFRGNMVASDNPISLQKTG
ncbi:MAG: type II CRISPR RNA-guided endonuclease Cas9, partial [Clostridiales bacterium]|nr:type II CRISPR RNA-guided endonuclease Cas9 [Clostridiales bacterium]